MNIHEWAARWGVSGAALAELRTHVFNHDPTPPAIGPAKGEAAMVLAVRVEAAKKGMRLWRNNVGGFYDEAQRFVRYGLANDSQTVNAQIKSGDLIGVRPVLITPDHVGRTVGQFISREIKAPGWHYTATEREKAQQRWAELVVSLGGDAGFATGEGTL